MIKIRPFEEADWKAVAAIHDAARPDELRGSCDPRAFVPLEEDPEVEELKACDILVAEKDGEVIGFSGVNGAYLGWLYVHPRYYGQGVGRGLLRAALNQLSGTGWTIVLEGNQPALNIYQSEGFRIVDRFASDNAGYPCTCLRLELSR